MDSTVVWVVIGIVLVIVELTTGTLYLLFLGLAAIAAAIAAWLGGNMLVQALTFVVAAIASVIGVQTYRKRQGPVAPMAALEAGQPVNFETWIDRERGLARVRFRGSSWDAQVSGGCNGEDGEVLYVNAVNGSTLAVAKSRP
jgi:membrane protein implicated in regulation of membrane protease activity